MCVVIYVSIDLRIRNAIANALVLPFADPLECPCPNTPDMVALRLCDSTKLLIYDQGERSTTGCQSTVSKDR